MLMQTASLSSSFTFIWSLAWWWQSVSLKSDIAVLWVPCRPGAGAQCHSFVATVIPVSHSHPVTRKSNTRLTQHSQTRPGIWNVILREQKTQALCINLRIGLWFFSVLLFLPLQHLWEVATKMCQMGCKSHSIGGNWVNPLQNMDAHNYNKFWGTEV